MGMSAILMQWNQTQYSICQHLTENATKTLVISCIFCRSDYCNSLPESSLKVIYKFPIIIIIIIVVVVSSSSSSLIIIIISRHADYDVIWWLIPDLLTCLVPLLACLLALRLSELRAATKILHVACLWSIARWCLLQLWRSASAVVRHVVLFRSLLPSCAVDCSACGYVMLSDVSNRYGL